MINEEQIEVFVNAITNYYKKMGGEFSEINVSTPFLANKDKIKKEIDGDYTGIIKIKGKFSGVVCFNASKEILDKMLKIMYNETNSNNHMLKDLVGEVANIISGNARKNVYFGDKFQISTPKVVTGIPDEDLFSDSNSYVIPLEWNNSKASLLISIRTN